MHWTIREEHEERAAEERMNDHILPESEGKQIYNVSGDTKAWCDCRDQQRPTPDMQSPPVTTQTPHMISKEPGPSDKRLRGSIAGHSFTGAPDRVPEWMRLRLQNATYAPPVARTYQ